MFKFLKESLIAQILFVLTLAVILYFAIPWLLDRLGGIFNLYEDSFTPLERTY